MAERVYPEVNLPRSELAVWHNFLAGSNGGTLPTRPETANDQNVEATTRPAHDPPRFSSTTVRDSAGLKACATPRDTPHGHPRRRAIGRPAPVERGDAVRSRKSRAGDSSSKST